MNFSSLHLQRGQHTPVHAIAFQDFLARPFAVGDTPPPPQAPAAGRPNSVPDFHLFGASSGHTPTALLQPSYSASSDGSFDGMSPSPVGPDPRGRKRVYDSDDRRYIRMMKNREAAARSRARKEARTLALESEVNNLLKENAKLIKQYQKLKEEAESHKGCNKKLLQRTTSAPF